MRRILGSLSFAAALLAFAGAALAECPPGFELKDGRCEIKKDCPAGTTMRDGRCVAAANCPFGTQNLDGFCVAKPPSGSGK
jgi:hypothetical protein